MHSHPPAGTLLILPVDRFGFSSSKHPDIFRNIVASGESGRSPLAMIAVGPTSRRPRVDVHLQGKFGADIEAKRWPTGRRPYDSSLEGSTGFL